MTIADIFDALTQRIVHTSARWLPKRRWRSSSQEATAGRLDADLVQILVDSQVYKRILDVDWQQL